MKSPVALLFFRRETEALRVFERIRAARPPVLLLAADAGRTEHGDEVERCLRLRREIEARIDWPCHVLTNYAEQNLGCRRRVSSALDWVFQNVERCILLEDDTLPEPTFFDFCDELLDRYADEEGVLMISGNHFETDWHRPRHSYTFVSHTRTWGWATWRRAWQHFDVEMKAWPAARAGTERPGWLAEDARIAAAREVFDLTHAGGIDTWDYQWLFAVWRAGGLCVQPAVNLVTNIGFGGDATHTHDDASPAAALPTQPLRFPLEHPPHAERDHAADRAITGHRPLWRRVWRRLRQPLAH